MLPTKLYLDTARLGQTSPSALQAQIDFARLTAEDPSSLYFEKFLRDGVDACPEIADRFPGLAHWGGIADLKRRLASMAGDPDQLRVLLANRSAELMRLAARCQFQVCRNVLVTDLSWPNWLAILKEEATRAGGRVTMAHISRAIMRDRCSSDDVCDHLSRVYATHECDGLFLPIVSNLGVHLPLAKIVAALRTVGPVNYTIADGAQALNHVDLTEPMKVSDFIVAGCHKWMRAGQAMAVGVVGQRRELSRHVGRLVSDPLLSFTEAIETHDPVGRWLETSGLSPVFACSGAIVQSEIRFYRFNRQKLQTRESLWCLCETRPEFCSNSILLIAADKAVSKTSPLKLRQKLHDLGIALTAYASGTLRLSACWETIPDQQIETITNTISSVSV